MRCLEQRYNKFSRYSDSGKSNNRYSRYNDSDSSGDSGKSNICDKYTGYSAYARCLGYPSIRSPAAILSSVHRPIHRTDTTVTGQLTGAIFTQSVGPQSHESPLRVTTCSVSMIIVRCARSQRQRTRNQSACYPQKSVVRLEISCVKFSIVGSFLTVVQLRLSAGFQKFCYSQFTIATKFLGAEITTKSEILR